MDFEAPAISHDGRTLAYLRTEKGSPAAPTDIEVWVAGIDGANPRRLAADWDRWATSIQFAADDAALIATADSDGRGPIYRIPLDGAAPEQLTTDDFTYTHVAVDRASGDLVALRSNWLAPSHPVRIARDGTVTSARDTGRAARGTGDDHRGRDDRRGRRPRARMAAAAGRRIGCRARTAAAVDPRRPARSWNAWSWRWAPLLAAARGYAVLLPDPALSTGYGLEFIARGWNSWGGKPYTDLMSITDAVTGRPDIDETKTAAMGGSFGGYMANWVAGHTDRFRAIVTHASLWAIDQFGGTTDSSEYWQRIFTPEAMMENSPHRFVDGIRTPLLVIHGDRDYRVPIGESLRLWSELAEHHAAADGSTRASVPVLPRREPLGSEAPARRGLVPDRLRVPGPARARRRMEAPRTARLTCARRNRGSAAEAGRDTPCFGTDPGFGANRGVGPARVRGYETRTQQIWATLWECPQRSRSRTTPGTRSPDR